MTKEEIIERIEDLLETSKENMEYYESKYESTEAKYYYQGKVEVLTKLLKEIRG